MSGFDSIKALAFGFVKKLVTEYPPTFVPLYEGHSISGKQHSNWSVANN